MQTQRWYLTLTGRLFGLLLCVCGTSLTATAQLQLDRPKRAEPLPSPFTLGLPREQILETARLVLKRCDIAFEPQQRPILPLEDKLLTEQLYFAEGVNSRSDLGYYANLPAADVRVWTGGRVRLEISALPLDERRSQLQITARLQGRVAPIGEYARDEQWVDISSNGRLEDEVLRGLAGKMLGIDLSVDQDGRRRLLKCEY